MSKFDLSTAQLPELVPLKASFEADDVERELKQVFLNIFGTHLSAKAFDANVLGVPHLGSFELVRKSVNNDGLVLLQGDREQAATRYLYRAWKARNGQGRGLFFLRTYLQMLFPNECTVDQLWQHKTLPYPKFSFSEKEILHNNFDFNDLFLTSRVRIGFGLESHTTSVNRLLHVIRSVIPARLVPQFLFLLRNFYDFEVKASSYLRLKKAADAHYPWGGLRITSHKDKKWQLGLDPEPVCLPAPFGGFKIGEKRREKPCFLKISNNRVSSNVTLFLSGKADLQKIICLDDQDRRINGTWRLGQRAYRIGVTRSTLKISALDLTQTTSLMHCFASAAEYPKNRTRLGRTAKNTLKKGVRLDGTWTLGGSKTITHCSFGFRLISSESISAKSGTVLRKSATSEFFIGDRTPRLGDKGRRLDGSWRIGQKGKGVTFLRSIKKKSAIDLPATASLEHRSASTAQYPKNRTKLGRTEKNTLKRGVRLDGSWTLGGSKTVTHCPFGFRLISSEPISAKSGTVLRKSATSEFFIGDRTPRLGDKGRRLDGSWSLKNRSAAERLSITVKITSFISLSMSSL